MNEKKYKNKIELQQKTISRQQQQIADLELQVRNLKLEIEEKNMIINSTSSLRKELSENVAKIKKHKEEYHRLIEELRKMKEILNIEVYKGKWKLVKFLIK